MLFRSLIFFLIPIVSVIADPTVDVGGSDGDDILLTYDRKLQATADCYNFLFSIMTDEFPEDTKYTLTNSNGGVIWEENPWGIGDQGKNFEHEACLPVDDCYTFVVSDNAEYQDG